MVGGGVNYPRVAIEKPIADTYRHARRLLSVSNGFQIYSLNHKVFGLPVLAFLEQCRKDPDLLRQVRSIEAVFYERSGFKYGRQQEDCVEDVQIHPFMAGLVAPFRAARIPFAVKKLERVSVATHQPDPDGQYASPNVWTASRIQAQVQELVDAQEVMFDSRQLKGAPNDDKVIRYYGSNGELLMHLDLSDSGSRVYVRMLEAVMQPRVDMWVSLVDAIEAMKFIDACRKRARVEPSYPFGTLPDFLI